jgi:hypothetical protein
MLELLNATENRLYILSNFVKIESFSREIVPQVGTAPHLTHPKLGMLVLLGGNALQNFVMQLTQLRARQANRDSNLRVHTDRSRALEVLTHFRTLHQSPETVEIHEEDADKTESDRTKLDQTVVAADTPQIVNADVDKTEADTTASDRTKLDKTVIDTVAIAQTDQSEAGELDKPENVN